ncbi:dickkopf-related protein 1 [Crotalus adamanteus]|uniref:Dickkopf-related protein 1 n=1 Tax=Crotalus adamanteus TaxID=8729 RepID=A0AAW1BEK7_CROAD
MKGDDDFAQSFSGLLISPQCCDYTKRRSLALPPASKQRTKEPLGRPAPAGSFLGCACVSGNRAPRRLDSPHPDWVRTREPRITPKLLLENSGCDSSQKRKRQRGCLVGLAFTKMLALRGRGACRAWAAVAVALCFPTWFGTAAGGLPFNSNGLGSNSIKNPLSGGSSLSGGSGAMYDGSNKSRAGDPQKLALCAADEDCNAEEFCSTTARGGVSGGGGGGLVCLTCRKRRKRCFRDAMCCSGNFCNNGMCVEFDHFHPGRFEIITENFDHGTLDSHLKRTTTSSQMYHIKGQGAVCLRSSDCTEGLCCARHFWSKICKPVLKEGQASVHPRKLQIPSYSSL